MLTIYFKKGAVGNMESYQFEDLRDVSKTSVGAFTFIPQINSWIPWTKITKMVEKSRVSELFCASSTFNLRHVIVHLQEGESLDLPMAQISFDSNMVHLKAVATDPIHEESIYIPNWNVDRVEEVPDVQEVPPVKKKGK